MSDLVTPYLDRLVACLCTELAKTEAGTPCRCCLQPGPFPPMDACCNCPGGGNGQAAGSVVSLYPSSTFPRPGVALGSRPCAGDYVWAAELALVVYRCVHVVDKDGLPPTCEQLGADQWMILADAEAMRQAIECCDWNTNPATGVEADIVPGSWAPIQPQGGCAGGQITVNVNLGEACCIAAAAP